MLRYQRNQTRQVGCSQGPGILDDRNCDKLLNNTTHLDLPKDKTVFPTGALVGKYTIWFSAIGCPVFPWVLSLGLDSFLNSFSYRLQNLCHPLYVIIYGAPLKFISQAVGFPQGTGQLCGRILEYSSCVFLTLPHVWGGTQ